MFDKNDVDLYANKELELIASLRDAAGSSYTGGPLPPDLNRTTFRAPVSMQPKPRAAKIAPPVVGPPAAPISKAPPAPGRLITVGAYLGDEARPHRKDDEAVQS